MDFGGWSRVIQQFGFSDPLLNPFIKSAKVGILVVFRVALRLHRVVLEGADFDQELLVEQPQFLLLVKDVLTVESYLLSSVI